MVLQTKLDQIVAKLRPILILCVGCAYSLLIATNIRCHGSLAMFLTEEPGACGVPQVAVHWLGATPGMVTYLFIPLFTGIIDHFKMNYRICALVGSGAIAVGSVMSTGLLDPGQLILTDALASGCGASLVLSTILLVVDDNFPADSGLRILATTLVQGVAYATFFFVDAYSVLLNAYGWRTAFFTYGGVAGGLGLLAALLFERRPRPHLGLTSQLETSSCTQNSENKQRTDGESVKDGSVIDRIHNKVEWKSRLLSLSQKEMDSSRTILLWLLERLLAAVVSDTAFLFLLARSGISRYPMVLGSTPSPRLNSILLAFVFSLGSTTSYLGGAVLGCLIKGRLLTVYMTCAMINACALIGWAAVIGSYSYNAELAFAWACGFGVGGINTFAYAASEEATGITARSLFPYTKLASGLSIALVQVAYGTLIGSDSKPLDLLLVMILLLSVGQFAVLVLIRQMRCSNSAAGTSKLRRWQRIKETH